MVTLDDIPVLVESAFDAAKARGKVDWRKMTTAVLKNRLLQMTEHRFDENALGFSSLGDLLTQFPELIRLDHTTRPTTVVFLGEAASPVSRQLTPSSPQMRIREDLWNAALNYSAGHDWVWDRTAREARAPREGEPEGLVMPTLSRDEVAGLRDAFASEISDSATGRDLERVERWRGQGLGTGALPAAVRGRWNDYVKSAVVARLTEWFGQYDIPLPNDFLRADVGSMHQTDDELARLRALVIDCVRSMTLAELASLDLPAGAVFRAQAHRSSRHAT